MSHYVQPSTYRGRLAPSPTGLLHVGHACTFWCAYQRAVEHRGTLILRNEDLDPQRSKQEFVNAFIEDLHWLGIQWSEGPDVGGGFGPYSQSERRDYYLNAWKALRDGGYIYPCTCSRKELAQSASAPNDDDEPIYPGLCRDRIGEARDYDSPAGVNWRFRVPEGELVGFCDLRLGWQMYHCGRDFGDFVVWRRDDVPAYQLAVVVDDAHMCVTEVARGADLLKSTARQVLLYRAMRKSAPAFHHCALVCDENGERLAKRHDALSIRTLRERGLTPKQALNACSLPETLARVPR